MKKVYTKEETELFLMKRNQQRLIDRIAKKGRAVSVYSGGGTFVGSIRKQFTGEKRCNITNQL